MITAHVNKMGIVMRFDSPADDLSSEAWESLLDDLKSHRIASFYQYGKRMHTDVSADGKLRFVPARKPRSTRRLRPILIYLTPKTATVDEAIAILRKRNIAVTDVPRLTTVVRGEDWKLVSSKGAVGDWRVTSFSSSSPPMGRGHFFSGFLLSLPVIRWFAPKCGARISEGLNAQAREAWEGEAWGDLRCTKPRWHRGHHVWLNPLKGRPVSR